MTVAGSSGASLTLLAATAAAQGEVVLYGIPQTRTVTQQVEFLQLLGKHIVVNDNVIHVQPNRVNPLHSHDIPTFRSSLYFLGPLVASCGGCTLPLPSTVATGSQPVDLHIKALQALGAKVAVNSGSLQVDAQNLRSCDICLDVPSYSATWTAICAATRAKGTTRIIGASRAPETVDAANLLNRMGARIVGAGTETSKVTGPTQLSGGEHTVMPDRITTGLYLIMAVATNSNLEIRGIIPDHLRSPLAKLVEMGAQIAVNDDKLVVYEGGRLRGVSVRTGFYPGFPSHLQPAMCSLLLLATDTSIVSETVFDDRMFHLEELQRMGVHITRDGQTAIIRGKQAPGSARVRASDAGAAAALMVAALVAQGKTVIEQADMLLDWFADPVAHMRQLGAVVEWENSCEVAG